MGFGTEIEGSDEIDNGGSDKQIWQDDFCEGGFMNVHLEHDQDMAHRRVLIGFWLRRIGLILGSK